MRPPAATLTLNINCQCGRVSNLVLNFTNDGSMLTLEEMPRGDWTCPGCGIEVEFRLQVQARMKNGSILQSVVLS